MNGEDTMKTSLCPNEGASEAPVVQRGAQGWGQGPVSPQVLGRSPNTVHLGSIDSYLRNDATVCDSENIANLV